MLAYVSGLLIDKYKDTKLKKVFLIFSIVISLGSLCLFKYSDFMITNINELFNFDIALLRLAMPIGISFYTFPIIKLYHRCI